MPDCCVIYTWYETTTGPRARVSCTSDGGPRRGRVPDPPSPCGPVLMHRSAVHSLGRGARSWLVGRGYTSPVCLDVHLAARAAVLIARTLIYIPQGPVHCRVTSFLLPPSVTTG